MGKLHCSHGIINRSNCGTQRNKVANLVCHVMAIQLNPNYAFEADAVRQRTVSCGVRAPRGCRPLVIFGMLRISQIPRGAAQLAPR